MAADTNRGTRGTVQRSTASGSEGHAMPWLKVKPTASASIHTNGSCASDRAERARPQAPACDEHGTPHGSCAPVVSSHTVGATVPPACACTSARDNSKVESPWTASGPCRVATEARITGKDFRTKRKVLPSSRGARTASCSRVNALSTSPMSSTSCFSQRASTANERQSVE